MNWVTGILQKSDARQDLIQIRHEVARLAEDFRVKTAGMKLNSPEYQSDLSKFTNEFQLLTAQIAKIETEQMLKRADYWRVPIPFPPLGTDESNEIWDWHRVHGQHYLSDTGLSKIRREAYQEWEIWWKPWLSWGAIIISVISLIVAVART